MSPNLRNFQLDIYLFSRNLFAKYPNIDYRIKCIQDVKINNFPDDCVFSGIDKSGELVARIQFDSQCLYFNNLKVFARLMTTSALGTDQKIKSVEIWSDGKRFELEDKRGIILLPNDEAGCTFEAGGTGLIDRIDRVRIKIKNVLRWEKM